MPLMKSPADVARELKAPLLASGRSSRRMRSVTFWREFGVLRRTPASVQRVSDVLAGEALAATVPGDVLGSEGRLAWITLSLVEPARPAPPSRVDFAAGEALWTVAAAGNEVPTISPATTAAPQATVTSGGAGRASLSAAAASVPVRKDWAGVGTFAKRHPIALMVVLVSLCGTLAGGWVGPVFVMAFLLWTARSDLFVADGFATRHPIAFTLMLFGASSLIAGHRVEVLVALAGIAWIIRTVLQRTPRLAAQFPSVDTVLDRANGHRIGATVTGVFALLTLSAIGAMLGGQPPADESTARGTAVPATEAPTRAPNNLGVVPESTATIETAATATIEPTATTEPATPTEKPPTATNTLPPATATPVPPPPTARPPSDIDPNRDQNCDSFPNYETMKAWRDYWRARGIRNPGRLDGNGNGAACEEGEGGRPAPPRPPAAPVPLYQAPAPAPASGGGGGGGDGGCCVHCKSGKPCGNSCIAQNKTCHKGAGCACGGG